MRAMWRRWKKATLVMFLKWELNVSWASKIMPKLHTGRRRYLSIVNWKFKITVNKVDSESLKRVFFKTNPKLFHVDVNISILPPTCWSFHVGLNENANSFFATRCCFWSSTHIGFPGKAKQHCAHKHCFIRITGQTRWKWDQSQQINVTQRSGLEKWIVWESLSK